MQFFDKNLRVRKTSFNIAVFYMILIDFLYLLILAKLNGFGYLYVGFRIVQPFVVIGIPLAVVFVSETKYTRTLPKVSYSLPPVRKRDYLYVPVISIVGWLCYIYFSYFAEGMYSAISGTVVLRIPVSVLWWEILLAIVYSAVIAAGLREYFFRFLGRKAYGGSVCSCFILALLSAMIYSDVWIALRLFIVGLLCTVIYFGSGRIVLSYIAAAVFESINVVLPQLNCLPLAANSATSVEMALVYGLYDGAVACIFAIILYWLVKSVRFKIGGTKIKLKTLDIVTLTLCFVSFIALLIWKNFI